MVLAYGAAFDNPEMVVACVVGDGEAETGPLAASWHANKFLNPARDGAVLPILHLNGYKIANLTVLARIPGAELDALLRGYGYLPYYVEGSEPEAMHRRMAAVVDAAISEIGRIQQTARHGGGSGERPCWPVIVLRTPKGWTGPAEVDGLPVEGTWRAHQVPLVAVRERPEHLAMLEQWLRSYRPEELFDVEGRPSPSVVAGIPRGGRRMGANPHANGGLLLRPLRLPDPAPGGIVTPRKTPPGGELSKGDKANNTVISGLRAPVERLVAHFKSWRILHTDYRRPYHTYREAYDAARGLFFFSISRSFE